MDYVGYTYTTWHQVDSNNDKWLANQRLGQAWRGEPDQSMIRNELADQSQSKRYIYTNSSNFTPNWDVNGSWSRGVKHSNRDGQVYKVYKHATYLV